MANEEPIVSLEARLFTLYSLRIVPLWDGDTERIDLGSNLREIVDSILQARSVSHFIGHDSKPMRFCQLEQQAAIELVGSQQTYYAREMTPAWKVMVPASGIYSRETIMSCITRSAGRNIEKYQNALFLYPQAERFYTSASNEIRAVDESVFVLEHPAK